MTTEELIAALSSAPVGTRELGVAVLEAVGARTGVRYRCWFAPGSVPGRSDYLLRIGDEARVVCDLNFRLPGVPEGWWTIWNTVGGMWRVFMVDDGGVTHEAHAHTEALARIVVQLKAALATK